jgi:hypothetical protein
MNRQAFVRGRIVTAFSVVLALGVAPRLHAQRGGAAAPPRDPNLGSITDPRVGLRSGMEDAGVASKNMELISHRQKPDTFNRAGGLTYANSDMAFRGNFVYQGNFDGFQIWDVSNPKEPVMRKAFVCTTGQGDPSIWGNLLFISSEGTGDRKDCSNIGVHDSVSVDRSVGVRIFDVSDPENPRKVADVQTCRGSHTHTLVPDPKDKGIMYIYVSGSARPRSPTEMPGCLNYPIDSTNSALFRIEVIRVPLAHPEESKVVSSARIFDDLTGTRAHGNPPGDTLGRGGRGGGRGGAPADPNAPRPGPNQCHDITVYPAIGLAGGACGGLGLLLDIHDPLHPKRIDFAADTNFSFWHSATFSNDGSKVLFSDEWGGGQQPKCREIDPLNWGGDALFRIEDGKLHQQAYFKMPAAQTVEENCVAHNGSLVPVPGRDIMVQAWYQGGVDVYDWTDPMHPREIAYFDRGPIPNHPELPADSQSTAMVTGGYWAGYWWNGHIYASEIVRGLDVFDLTPSEWLTQNEIDAAKLVHMETFNPQMQPKIVWPAAFPVARAYLDQLVRDDGLPRTRTLAIAATLNSAEKQRGAARGATLEKLGGQLDNEAASASDTNRVKWLAATLHQMAKEAK